MLVFYIAANLKKGFVIEYASVLLLIAGFVIYVLYMPVLNLITQKNDLTLKSTNTILLFAFLTAILPNSLTDMGILVANLFLILGIRSVLTLGSGKHIKATILDASLCIGIASLAYFWSIAFISILFLGILYFEPKNYRNWVIPIIGLMIVYILTNCFTLVFYDSFFEINNYMNAVSFSFENYLTKDSIFSSGVLIICVVFFFSMYITKFKRKPAKTKPVVNLILMQLLVGLIIVIIAPEKNTSEMIFIAGPLAIIGTTYLELDYNELVKEINIWVFLLIPFIALLF